MKRMTLSLLQNRMSGLLRIKYKAYIIYLNESQEKCRLIKNDDV